MRRRRVGESEHSTASKRRIPPAPFDSPPFPAGDWQIGGTPIIGDPGILPTYPLMEAIYAESLTAKRGRKAESRSTAGRISPSTSALRATPRAARTRIFRSSTICGRTASSKTNSFSTSSACRMKPRPITSTGASGSRPFTDSITGS